MGLWLLSLLPCYVSKNLVWQIEDTSFHQHYSLPSQEEGVGDVAEQQEKEQ